MTYATTTTGLPTYDLIVSVVVFKPDMDKLTACLDSVLTAPEGRNGLALRVYLVDNSPQPLGEDVLAGYRAAYGERLTYVLTGANLGFGGGHNQVIAAHAQDASYWLVLNPDAYFTPGLLEDLYARMEADKRVGLCIPRICNPDSTMQYVNKRLPTPDVMFLRPFMVKWPWLTRNRLFGRLLWRIMEPRMQRFLLGDLDLTKPLTCPFISGCFMFFRADLLAELQGFDDRYFLYMEDLDLSRRVAARALNVVYSDLVCFHHWERGAYKNRRLFRLLVTSAISYFNRWGWLLDGERTRLNRAVGYYQVKPYDTVHNETGTPKADAA